MGMQTCRNNHQVMMPHYGALPGCPDCRDLIKNYSGYDTEDDIPGHEDFEDSEDDMEDEGED